MFFNDSFCGSIEFVLSFNLSLFEFEVVCVSRLLFSITCVFYRVLSHCSGTDDLMILYKRLPFCLSISLSIMQSLLINDLSFHTKCHLFFECFVY